MQERNTCVAGPTQRHRGKDGLCITAAEEYRERLELMTLLEKALPEADAGSKNWYA